MSGPRPARLAGGRGRPLPGGRNSGAAGFPRRDRPSAAGGAARCRRRPPPSAQDADGHSNGCHDHGRSGIRRSTAFRAPSSGDDAPCLPARERAIGPRLAVAWPSRSRKPGRPSPQGSHAPASLPSVVGGTHLPGIEENQPASTDEKPRGYSSEHRPHHPHLAPRPRDASRTEPPAEPSPRGPRHHPRRHPGRRPPAGALN